MLTSNQISNFNQPHIKQYLLHFIAWLFFGLLFLIGFSGIQPLSKTLLLVSILLGLSIPAVYLHFYLVEKFLRKRIYVLYTLAIVTIIFLYGRAIDFAARNLIFPNESGVYVAGEFILIVFILMASGLNYFFKGLEDRNKLSETVAKKTKAELDSLKMQMNPHFLFNSLNNIYGLMDDNTLAAQSMLKLSSLLRYMLDTSQKSLVSLHEEVQFIEDYISMERLRLNSECKIELFKEGEFSKFALPPFLLIPLVENVFKHGKLNGSGSFINVNISISDHQLILDIKNSKRKNESSGHMMGIANVRRRLDLLNKVYSLNIGNDKETFHALLTIKL